MIDALRLFEEDPELFIQEISNAFSPIVDFKRIARNVMGKHYKVSTPSQRVRFSEAFRTSLLNTYSKTLIEFKDEEIIVLPPKNNSNSPNKVKVDIEIVTSSKSYPGVYSMYLDKNNEWKQSDNPVKKCVGDTKDIFFSLVTVVGLILMYKCR